MEGGGVTQKTFAKWCLAIAIAAAGLFVYDVACLIFRPVNKLVFLVQAPLMAYIAARNFTDWRINR